MFAYCGNNPVMGYDGSGYFTLFALCITVAVVALCTVALSSCERIDRTELIKDSYCFDEFDSLDEGLSTKMHEVYSSAEKDNFEYEYGCVIVKFDDDIHDPEKYYISNIHTDGSCTSVNLPFPDDAIPIGTIHFHPWYLSEPYTKDKSRDYDQYIIDIEGNQYCLPANKAIDQFESVFY